MARKLLTIKLTTMTLSPSKLAEFKKAAKDFYIMYESLVQYWNKKNNENEPDLYPIATTINVLVQNVQFNGVNCEGYDHQKEVDNVEEIIKLLKVIYDYDKSYMSLLPYDTISRIWELTYMSDLDEKW